MTAPRDCNARVRTGLAVIASIVSLAGPARAGDEVPAVQPTDSSQEAREQYQAGMDVYQAKRFVEAALHFEAAVVQRPHAVALYTAALAWEQANRPERAADDFARALEVAGLSGAQAQNARDRLAILERAMGTLEVTAPEGWRVQLDANTGVPVPAHLHAMPGVHALAIQAHELPIQHRDVTLELGKVTRLELTPVPSAPAAPPPKVAFGEPPPSVRAGPAVAEVRRDVGFVVVGAGVASLGAGVALGVNALSARDAYNAGPTRVAYDHASSLQTWTDVAFIAGGAFVALGAALVFVARAGLEIEGRARDEPLPRARGRRRAGGVLRKGAVAYAFVLVVAVAGAVVHGCALGLDPSKVGASVPDASLPPPFDAEVQDATAPDSADAAPTEAAAEAAADADADADAPSCLQNADCVSANGCQVGSCDAGGCSFAVCPAGACQGSSCSSATNACTLPTAYGFHAAEVNVALGPVGCGGSASACIAAAYPFVFVGTANGAIAYAVSDPSNPSPRSVVVTGLPFIPAYMTSMGSRVFFVGTPQGTGPTYRLPIGSLDVPSDPLATTLAATSTLAVVSVSGLASVAAASDGSLFLWNDDSTESYPAAKVAPPFKDEMTVGFFPSAGITQGAWAVSPSGSRLLVGHWKGATTPFQTAFSFETNAGTASAQNSGESPTLAGIGPTGPNSNFAQGSDGSVVWNTATSTIDDGGNDFGGVRAAWLVGSGTATAFTAASFVDVETYAPPVPYGNLVVGPIAWVDPTTALVLAAAAGTVSAAIPGQTSVQVAVNATKPALASGRRYVIAQSVGLVGAAASGGFGYVLAAGASGGNACTLHIFAPACASP